MFHIYALLIIIAVKPSVQFGIFRLTFPRSHIIDRLCFKTLLIFRLDFVTQE